MQIGLATTPIVGSRMRSDAVAPTPPDPLAGLAEREAETRQRERIEAASLRLGELADLLRAVRVRGATTGAVAIGLEPLLLDESSSAASLSSFEEVNTRTTAFAPASPAFVGTSTIPVSVDGVYDGAQGSGTLTFTVTAGGIRGVSSLRFEVTDPGGDPFHEIVIGAGDPVGQSYALPNGLSLTFGNGFAVPGDRFTVEVQNGLTFGASPDRPLDGSGGDPGLDDGFAVSAGSFEVNGTAISVDPSDSIDDVLGRISASAAGVAAVYDAAADVVRLTQNASGAGPSIVVGNDTSGFLAAVKLDVATVVPGTDSDLDLALADVAAFAGVASGSFGVNGAQVTIDVAVDRLSDVLARIEAQAGVEARLLGGRVRIRALEAGGSIVLDDPTTGFFAAAGIATGTFEPRSRAALARGQIVELREAAGAAVAALNGALRPAASALEPAVARLRTALGDAVSRALAGRAGTASTLGFELDFSASDGIVFGDAQARAFERILARDFVRVERLLAGRGAAAPGLIDELRRALGADVFAAPPRGAFLDVFA